jgi:hypothetical protein
MKDFLLDTDILSLFAKVDALPLLCHLLRNERLPITPAILNELLVPLEYGYDFPREILAIADMILMLPEEIPAFQELRLGGKLSAADAEMIAICQNRRWIYITMDRVAAGCAASRGVRTMDLRALLAAIGIGGLLTRNELQILIEKMEKADRTTLPYKEDILSELP